MAKLISTILMILLLSAPAYASKALLEVSVNWTNGQQLPDGSWVGPIPIIPSATCFHDPANVDNDCLKGTDKGLSYGGFSGWYSGNEVGLLTLKIVEDGKLTMAHVYIYTTEDKLTKMALVKEAEEYKYKIVSLLDESAQSIKDDLPVDNNGDQDIGVQP